MLYFIEAFISKKLDPNIPEGNYYSNYYYRLKDPRGGWSLASYREVRDNDDLYLNGRANRIWHRL